MTKEEIFRGMEESINHANLKGFEEQVELLLQHYKDEDASLIVAEYLFKKYTAFKADALAAYMEVAIRKRPNLAILNHPDNPLFRLSVITGSKDLYDCYIEEAVEPFLANVNSNEHMDHYFELMTITEKMDEMIFNNYNPRLKGLHYNGAVSGAASHMVALNREDYEAMEEVMEQYNAILGRRDILKDLNRRIDEIE